jgi:hypothetical protein
MAEKSSVTITALGLPPAELAGLLQPLADADGVVLQVDHDETRHVDSAVAVAVLNFTGALAAPFVVKLAERLFSKAPKAALLGKDSKGSDVEVTPADDPAVRDAKLTIIVSQPHPQLTIHLT